MEANKYEMAKDFGTRRAQHTIELYEWPQKHDPLTLSNGKILSYETRKIDENVKHPWWKFWGKKNIMEKKFSGTTFVWFESREDAKSAKMILENHIKTIQMDGKSAMLHQ